MSNLYNDPDDFNLDEDDFEEELEDSIENIQTESIRNMIETILSGNLVESTQSFTDIITAKIAARLDESKINVAQRVFGIQESDDHDDDDNDDDAYSKTISKMKKPKEDDYKDEKHAEVDDDSFSKSLHGRLKNAEDMDDHPLKDDEKENPNDKRVQAGLAARAAKGEMSKPNAHRDIDLRQGSVTLQDGDAKRINNFMAGLKPEKRQEVMAHMQKSPKHFNAVHDVIKKFPAPKQNTSIYGEDFQAEALDMSSLKAIGGKSRGSVEDQKAKRAATVKPSTSPSVTGAGDKQSYHNPKNAPKNAPKGAQ